MTQQERVFEFIKNNPGCNNQKISDELGIKWNSVNNACRKLWFDNKIGFAEGGGWKLV